MLLLAFHLALATTYWTLPDLMRSFFAQSERVTYRQVTLDDGALLRIAAATGRPLEKREWTVYVGKSGERDDGFALVDSELGQHEPIDFAVLFDPSGVVQRVEVMAYREAYGEAVRSERFRRQFTGKKTTDAIAAGRDIDIISGASISSRSLLCCSGCNNSIVLFFDGNFRGKYPYFGIWSEFSSG